MFTLEQCRLIVRTIRDAHRLKKANEYLQHAGTSIHLTVHLADRLYDHSIDLKKFVDTFYQLLSDHLLITFVQAQVSDGGFKFSLNDLVFVFERGVIDKKIVLKTVYPLRPGKHVDLDKNIIRNFRQMFVTNHLQQHQ
jgi:hypothetical protein